MNFLAFPELLLSWVRNQGAALLQGGKGDQAQAFKVGAEYDGKVLDQLANGRHLVQVGGQKLDMNLPANTRAGDTVKLTFLNAGPRPTFLLNQVTPAAPQQVNLSNTVQQVNALIRFAQSAPVQSVPTQPVVSLAVKGLANTDTGGAPGTNQASLGPSTQNGIVFSAVSARGAVPTEGPSMAARAEPAASGQTAGATIPTIATNAPARILAPAGNAASAQTGSATPRAPASINANAMASATSSASARPIVTNVVMVQNYSAAATVASAATTTATTQFAQAGMVSAGRGLMGQAVDGLRAAIPASTTLKPNDLAELPEPSKNMLPVRLSQTLSESGLFYESHLARWTKGQFPFESLLREPQVQISRNTLAGAHVAELGGMPEEAARLAGRQLTMLAGMPFQWQGLAWPGQWMEWLVQERPENGGEGGASEEGRQWVTELRLTMPRMGQIQAQLSLSGRRLGIRLTAPDATIQGEMREALPGLVQGLEATGLQTVNLNLDIADARP